MELNDDGRKNDLQSELTGTNNELSSVRENAGVIEHAKNSETGIGENNAIKVNNAIGAGKEENLGEDNKFENGEEEEQSGSTSRFGSPGKFGLFAGGAAAAATVVVTVAVAASGFTASFGDVYLTGTQMRYNLNVCMEYVLNEKEEVCKNYFENMDTGLKLLVYNNNYSASYNLIIGESGFSNDYGSVYGEVTEIERKNSTTVDVSLAFVGTAYSLTPNTRYNLKVVRSKTDGGVETVTQTDVKTRALTSEIHEVSYVCKCAVDDCFYFNLDCVDENNYYSDFSYELIVAEDNACVPLGLLEAGAMVASYENISPYETQVIYEASAFNGENYELVISFTSTSGSDLSKVGTSEKIGNITYYYQMNDTATAVKIIMKLQVKL